MKVKTSGSVSVLMVGICVMLLLTGCFADLKTPMISLSANHNATAQVRVGSATCYQYVWVIGMGDCSVATAMRNGGLTRIHHVDTSMRTILFGAFSELTIMVYGE